MNNENKGKQVLLVMSNEDLRITFKGLFEKNGLEVFEARDGIEGLDVATTNPEVDVIFTSINMPRMDGVQFVQSLKETEVTKEIPIVVYAGLGKGEYQQKMLEMGVKEFIVRGTMTPIETVNHLLSYFSGGNYIISIDPEKNDGRKFLEDQGVSVDTVCEKCHGGELAFKLEGTSNGCFKIRPFCVNCERE